MTNLDSIFKSRDINRGVSVEAKNVPERWGSLELSYTKVIEAKEAIHLNFDSTWCLEALCDLCEKNLWPDSRPLEAVRNILCSQQLQ